MADNIQTELGVDPNVPVYANAKEAKKAAKKAKKEAKQAEKRYKKAEKEINKAIEKCQKEVNKAQKEKDPAKRDKKVDKAKEKLQKRIDKTTEKYPVEAKAVLAEKERAAATRKLRNRAPTQSTKAFDGVTRAYDTPDNSKPAPASTSIMDAMSKSMAAGAEKSNSGDPLIDLFTDLILAVVDEMKKRKERFNFLVQQREEERKLLAQEGQTRSSSGLETEALTQVGNQSTTKQHPSMAMIYRNSSNGMG